MAEPKSDLEAPPRESVSESIIVRSAFCGAVKFVFIGAGIGALTVFFIEDWRFALEAAWIPRAILGASIGGPLGGIGGVVEVMVRNREARKNWSAGVVIICLCATFLMMAVVCGSIPPR